MLKLTGNTIPKYVKQFFIYILYDIYIVLFVYIYLTGVTEEEYDAEPLSINSYNEADDDDANLIRA